MSPRYLYTLLNPPIPRYSSFEENEKLVLSELVEIVDGFLTIFGVRGAKALEGAMFAGGENISSLESGKVIISTSFSVIFFSKLIILK